MRILILSQYWWPEDGVPQRRWAWLASMLRDQGHEVIAVVPPANQSGLDTVQSGLPFGRNTNALEVGPNDETIVRCRSLRSRGSLTGRAFNQAFIAISMLWTCVRRLRHNPALHPDLVIGTVPALPTATVTRLVGKLFKVPYVIDLRDAWPDLLDYSGSWNQENRRRSLRERVLTVGPLQVVKVIVRKELFRAYRESSAMVFTAEALRKSMSMRLQRGPDSRGPLTCTVRNVFPPQTNISRSEVPKSDRKSLHVLYAGTLGRAQHLTNVIEALRRVTDNGVPVDLRLVGAGASSAVLREIVKESELPIAIYGRADSEAMARHYDWADTALVHLTDWEPLRFAVPSKTFELMQLGIHISAVAYGETEALVKDLGAGHAVPPEDPEALAELWESLYSDRSLLRIKQSAKEWVHNEANSVVPQIVATLLSNFEGKS